MTDPYRILAKLEPSVKKPNRIVVWWKGIDGELILVRAFIAILFSIVAGLIYLMVTDIIETRKETIVSEENKRNTCRIIANRSSSKFEVFSWNEVPEETVEGFFDTRKDAEEFMNSLPACQVKR